MATLLITIDLYFDDIAITWTVILWIFLFSAILMMLGQFIHAEKEIHSYSHQLTANKERLTNEIKHRLWAEKSTTEAKTKSQIIDENIPVLLAYFNSDQRCKYHNRIFRKWFGLKADQIDGKLLEEFADDAFTSCIKKHFKDILSGKTVHEERILKSTKGFPYIFTEQYVPHIDSKGRTIGFYTLHTPCAQDKNRLSFKKNGQPGKPAAENSSKDKIQLGTKKHAQSGISPDRIIQAIKGGEFYLYCQKIIPLDANSLSPTQYEILIRMAEEENNLMPPGSFLPLVDQLKMMPQLDRWVASYIVKTLSENAQKCRTVFSLNVAKDTLCDKTFIEFIQDKIQKSKIPPNQLCFEIEELDAKSNLIETMFFTEKIRELGCLVTLCGFSQDSQSVELLKKIKIDFLKIDGIIVCNMIYEHDDLAKVKNINQIARQLNIKTIAELVENKETISKLREIGIHYVQGLGVEKPYPLNNLMAVLQKTANASSISTSPVSPDK
ncbi:EAL domain-containing protein [Nitrosomonas sp. Nm51]|uniref:sensor domain-containing phosphodiesterase n=1 Tax=Nitrosomonas sp. Nm51 TaxID=133720 RepID=UPI00210A24A1|nr:EAL domain-containing protein [Nitrosomonas sp. Nm51]